MTQDRELKIFAGSASEHFTKKICSALGVTPGRRRIVRFTEGNIYVKIEEKVRGHDVYLVQTIGLDPNNEFMELLFWVDAFKRASVNSVTVIIPYFSYAKADKKDEPRVSIRARVCADCIESAGADRIVTMDLHSPQIQGFFRKPVDHLYASTVFLPYIRESGIADFVIVSPDEGFAKNARYYANTLRAPLAIGNKQRHDHSEKAEILNLMGDVQGKNCIIVDDFSISCNTLAEIAKLLRSKGAGHIWAFISHALMNEQGIEVLEKSHIEYLFTTDTVHNPRLALCNQIEILSVTSLFAKAIHIIHNHESLGDVFN